MALGKAVIASSCRSRVLVVVALLLTACAGSGDASLGGEPTQAATPEPTPSSQEFVRYEDPFGVFAFEYPAVLRPTRQNDPRIGAIVSFTTYDADDQGYAFSAEDVKVEIGPGELPEDFGQRDEWSQVSVAGQEAEVAVRSGEDLSEFPGVGLMQIALIRLPEPREGEGGAKLEGLLVALWTGRDTPDTRTTFARILESVRFLTR